MSEIINVIRFNIENEHPALLHKLINFHHHLPLALTYTFHTHIRTIPELMKPTRIISAPEYPGFTMKCFSGKRHHTPLYRNLTFSELAKRNVFSGSGQRFDFSVSVFGKHQRNMQNIKPTRFWVHYDYKYCLPCNIPRQKSQNLSNGNNGRQSKAQRFGRADMKKTYASQVIRGFGAVWLIINIQRQSKSRQNNRSTNYSMSTSNGKIQTNDTKKNATMTSTRAFF